MISKASTDLQPGAIVDIATEFLFYEAPDLVERDPDVAEAVMIFARHADMEIFARNAERRES